MEEYLSLEILGALREIAHGINNPWVLIVTLSGVIVALFLGVMGIFQDRIRRSIHSPKIQILIKTTPPESHKIAFTNSQTQKHICNTYYCRFRVSNIGNQQMEDVEAMIVEVQKLENEKFEKIQGFLPLNLNWSHYGGITLSKIQPKMFKHLDFFHVMEARYANLEHYGIEAHPAVVLLLDVPVSPNTGSHILLPGEYKVKIVFAANNLEPAEKDYRVKINNSWTEDESLMLKKNIEISEV